MLHWYPASFYSTLIVVFIVLMYICFDVKNPFIHLFIFLTSLSSCRLLRYSLNLKLKISSLQILRNNADGTNKGTLLWLMDHTHTLFGARLMRHWVRPSELSLMSIDCF